MPLFVPIFKQQGRPPKRAEIAVACHLNPHRVESALLRLRGAGRLAERKIVPRDRALHSRQPCYDPGLRAEVNAILTKLQLTQ